TPVGVGLRLLLHHPDDREGRTVQQHRLSGGVLLAEYVFRDLEAQEGDASLLGLVLRPEEAPSRPRIGFARIAVVPIRSDDAAVDRPSRVLQERATVARLAPGLHVRHPLLEKRDVVDARLDAPPFRESLPDFRGLARPADREVLPHRALIASKLSL